MDQLNIILNKHPQKIKMIIFESCFSDYNAQIILQQWKHKNIPPPIILTSSNSDSPSLKMTTDAWYFFANYITSNFPYGKKPTWNDFWNYLEGRLMQLSILESKNEINQHAISDPVLFWPVDLQNHQNSFMRISGLKNTTIKSTETI